MLVVARKPYRAATRIDPLALAEFQAGITPPAVFVILAFPSQHVDYWKGAGELIAYCLVGTLLWAGAAAWLWGATLLHFRAAIGREEKPRRSRAPLGLPNDAEGESS